MVFLVLITELWFWNFFHQFQKFLYGACRGEKRLFLRVLECQRFFAAKPFTFQNRLERSQSLLPQKGVDDFLASGWMKQK